MDATTARRQKHAIQVLRLYLWEGQEISRRIPEASPVTTDGDILQDFRDGFNAEVAKSQERLRDARHALVRSGFSVPDTWLTFPTIGTTFGTIEAEQAIAWIDSPEAESQWAEVLKSTEAALVRLDAIVAGATDDGMVTINDITEIAGVARRTVDNKTGKYPLPSPATPYEGKTKPAKYRYSEIRQWAQMYWPARESEFPATFAEAQMKLRISAEP